MYRAELENTLRKIIIQLSDKNLIRLIAFSKGLLKSDSILKSTKNL